MCRIWTMLQWSLQVFHLNIIYFYAHAKRSNMNKSFKANLFYLIEWFRMEIMFAFEDSLISSTSMCRNIRFSQWCFIHLLRGNIFINPAWAVESCHNNYNSSLCINSMLLQELSTGGLVKKNSSLHLLSRRRAKREGETETEAKVDEVSYLNNSISRTLTLDFFLHK